MRNIKFIIVAFVAMFVTLGSTSVFAQEDGNRDANGYVVKGPYLTNGGGSNWFVGIGGGFNTTFGKEVKPFAEFKPANDWMGEAFIGKWFTPTVGVRAGYKGGMTNFGYGDGFVSNLYGNGEQVRFGYAHADLMWNLSNAISGYKETRFWDIIPYAGAGIYGYNNGWTDNEFAVNAGIYNELRLGGVVNLFIDVNVAATENPLGLKDANGAAVLTGDTPYLERPAYTPSATVGITLNIGKKRNFDRYSSRVAPLMKEIEDLKAALVECQSRPVPEPVVKTVTETKEVLVKETKVLTGSTVITFALGKSKLTNVEADKVNMFAESFKDGETLIKVVGSADSKTGTKKGNEKLAKKRAEVVKNALVKAGIAESRVIVDDTIDATENVETSRSAIITLSAE